MDILKTTLAEFENAFQGLYLFSSEGLKELLELLKENIIEDGLNSAMTVDEMSAQYMEVLSLPDSCDYEIITILKNRNTLIKVIVG